MKLDPIVRAKFRVKIKSLAVEATIIRTEANGWNLAEVKNCLRGHRVGVLREESRATLLAYAWLRGLPYRKVEDVGSKAVNCKRVAEIVKSLSWKIIDPKAIQVWTEERKEKVA